MIKPAWVSEDFYVSMQSKCNRHAKSQDYMTNNEGKNHIIEEEPQMIKCWN